MTRLVRGEFDDLRGKIEDRGVEPARRGPVQRLCTRPLRWLHAKARHKIGDEPHRVAIRLIDREVHGLPEGRRQPVDDERRLAVAGPGDQIDQAPSLDRLQQTG